MFVKGVRACLRACMGACSHTSLRSYVYDEYANVRACLHYDKLPRVATVVPECLHADRLNMSMSLDRDRVD